MSIILAGLCLGIALGWFSWRHQSLLLDMVFVVTPIVITIYLRVLVPLLFVGFSLKEASPIFLVHMGYTKLSPDAQAAVMVMFVAIWATRYAVYFFDKYIYRGTFENPILRAEKLRREYGYRDHITEAIADRNGYR